MKSRTIIAVINAFILISVSYNVFSFLVVVNRVEVDETAFVTNIVDGDTFDISGERIRLADVDTPERGQYGYNEASNYLSRLIYGKRVYLDVDDVYRYDTYGTRLVCLVYVDYSATHYLNVNKALLVEGLARISDYPNEFSPDEWSRLVPKHSSIDAKRVLIVSVAVGFGFTIAVNVLIWFLKRIVKKGYGWITQFGRKREEGFIADNSLIIETHNLFPLADFEL